MICLLTSARRCKFAPSEPVGTLERDAGPFGSVGVVALQGFATKHVAAGGCPQTPVASADAEAERVGDHVGQETLGLHAVAMSLLVNDQATEQMLIGACELRVGNVGDVATDLPAIEDPSLCRYADAQRIPGILLDDPDH